MIRIELVGRLTRDPEFEMQGDQPVCRTRLAVEEIKLHPAGMLRLSLTSFGHDAITDADTYREGDHAELVGHISIQVAHARWPDADEGLHDHDVLPRTRFRWLPRRRSRYARNGVQVTGATQL